jgi:hypothetical protein
MFKDIKRLTRYPAEFKTDDPELERRLRRGILEAYHGAGTERKTGGPKESEFYVETIMKMTAARKIVLGSGQMQLKSWERCGFNNLDQVIDNLKMFTEVPPEDEALMREKHPELVAEYKEFGYAREATLNALYPNWATLPTHVGMDDAKYSRRASIPTHEAFHARWGQYVEAKKAKDGKEEKEKAERKAAREAKKAEKERKKGEAEGEERSEKKREKMRTEARKLDEGPAEGDEWYDCPDQQCATCLTWMSQMESTVGLEYSRGDHNHWAGCDHCAIWFCGDHKS